MTTIFWQPNFFDGLALRHGKGLQNLMYVIYARTPKQSDSSPALIIEIIHPEIDQTKLTPPVSPKILSSSGGGSTSFPMMLSLKPGAYSSIVLKI